jgi:hypothetical protein
MERKGLFNKVKNKPTRRKFLVSTIRKGDDVFETGVFVANFFYIPRHISQPDLAVVTHSQGEAWELHYRMTARLTEEHPMRVMQDYLQADEAATTPARIKESSSP